jgi:hypothetical protein
MAQRIQVYGSEQDTVRADHILMYFGVPVPGLHYHLTPKPAVTTVAQA